MKNLREMIDDTTERLLRKIDDWEIPQSDKKYVTIEKEVWEATLRRSMENTAKVETLEKQLDIAVKAIKAVLHDEFILEHADGGLVMYLTQAEYEIKELNK